MPFGLRNASQTFQSYMDSILQNLAAFSAYYIDDIIAFSRTMEDNENISTKKTSTQSSREIW